MLINITVIEKSDNNLKIDNMIPLINIMILRILFFHGKNLFMLFIVYLAAICH